MEKRIFTLIFLVSFFSVFIGCSYLETHKNIETECIKNSNESLAIKLKFDTLIHNTAQTNPDSAIYYSVKQIRYFDSIGCRALIFDSYFYLSEIYIYNKPNDYLATFYYSEGLKLMIGYNLEFEINPFYLIDLGNILFRHRLYQNAISNYKTAVGNAQKSNHKYAEAVALNNIGLSFMKIQQYDSAAWMFRKALEIRENIMPLLEAQNHLYLSKLFIETELPDSVLFHHSKITQLLQKQDFSTNAMSGISLKNAHELKTEIEIEKDLVMGKYLQFSVEAGVLNQAETYFRQAAARASICNKPLLLSEANILFARLLISENRFNEALSLIDTTLIVTHRVSNMRTALELCRMATALYSQMKLPDLEKQWMLKTLQFADSLLLFETSEQLLTEKILLLTAKTEQELSNSRINLQQNKIVIKNQSISILVLALSVIAISTFLTIVAVQRRKLNAAYHALVERTIQIIDKESSKHKAHDHPLADKQASALLHHLESLMLESQLYLDPEISMTNLAKHLGTNEKYLSMLFNNQLKTTFNDYINSLRIAEACRMMNKANKPNKSVEQIAEASGFGSRSAFYTAFKKYTGVTPAFFMKSKMGKKTG